MMLAQCTLMHRAEAKKVKRNSHRSEETNLEEATSQLILRERAIPKTLKCLTTPS